MEGMVRVSRTVDWEITSGCDSRCTHCISRLHHPRLARDLDRAQARTLVDRFARAGVRAVHLFGGEPLTREDLPDLLAALDRRGIRTSLTTNGQTLDEDRIRQLAALEHFHGLTVSFEDIREDEQDAVRGRGSHARAVAAQREVRDIAPQLPLTVAWTLNGPALRDLHPVEITGYFAGHGVQRIVVQDLAVPADAPHGLRALDYGPDLWKRWLERLFDPSQRLHIPVVYPLKPKVIDHLRRVHGYDIPLMRYGCNAMSCRIRVLPDGRVLPCSAVIGWEEALTEYLDCSPSLVDVPLDTLLEHEPYQRFAAIKRQRTDPMMEPCRSCEYAYFRCNPCVVGRLTGVAKVVRNCAWVQPGTPAPPPTARDERPLEIAP